MAVAPSSSYELNVAPRIITDRATADNGSKEPRIAVIDGITYSVLFRYTRMQQPFQSNYLEITKNSGQSPMNIHCKGIGEETGNRSADNHVPAHDI